MEAAKHSICVYQQRAIVKRPFGSWKDSAHSRVVDFNTAIVFFATIA